VIGLLAAALLAGCASGPDPIRALTNETQLLRAALIDLGRSTEEIRRELADVKSRIGRLQSEVEGGAREDATRQRDVLSALEALGARIDAAEKRVGEVEGLVSATQGRVAGLESRAGGIAARVDSLRILVKGVETTVGGLADQVARLESLPAPAPAPAEVKPDKPPTRTPVAALTADELFNRGMQALRNGELGQAILDFEDFLAKHPSHPLAGHAQFWIGEAYFTARDYQHAAAEYQKALDRAPKGEKTPEALFKLGLAYQSLKRPDRTRDVWAQLLRDFPQSEAAQKARSALRESLGAPRLDTVAPR
jgi:tol-pal system protein YbgF